MEAEEEAWSVFLRDGALALDRRTATALARSRGVTAIDVRKHLKECHGVIEEKIGEGRARALIRELQGQGIEAVMFPESEVLRFPPVIPVDRARHRGAGLEFRAAERRDDVRAGAWLRVEWDDLVYIAWARVSESATKKEYDVEMTHPGPAYFGGYGGGYLRGWRVVEKATRRQTRKGYLDFFAIRPARHFRIDPHRFAYPGILGKVAPTSHSNMVALVGLFRGHARHLEIDGSIHDLLDGDPTTSLKLSSPRAYELYLLWHIQMAFKGPESS